MGNDATIKFGGDSSALERELKKTQRQVDRLKIKLAKVGSQSRKAGRDGNSMAKSFQKVKTPLMGIAGALGVGGGIAAGVTTILNLTEKWRTHMREIAKLNRQAGQDMVAFALMQEGGKKRERVLEAAALGAKYGVGMGPAWSTVQALQAQTGGWGKGKAAAARSWQLAQVGVPQEEAGKAVSIGMGLGLTPGEAARLPYAAGEKSSLSPAEIAAGYSQALPFYKGMKGGPIMGASVMAQLSTIYKDPSKLGTYSGKFAQALKREKTWQGLGYTGEIGDVFGQLEFLQGKGIKTDLELQRAGFGEIRERAALSGMLGDVGKFKGVYADVKRMTGQEGLLQRKRRAAEAELPEMAYERATAASRESLALSKTFGQEAQQARIRDMIQLARGLMLQAKGYGSLVDPESGRVKGWGWQAGIVEAYTADIPIEEKYQARLRKAGVPGGEGSFYESPDIDVRERQLIIYLETINKYIEEQNKERNEHRKAIEENTKALQDQGMNYPNKTPHPGDY